MDPIALAGGILYLVHWFVVIPWVVLRMALMPKRLVWAKTLHLGVTEAEPQELESDPDLSTQVS
jgi:1,2-diacylglycerol 3-beta-glucosyltransferase